MSQQGFQVLNKLVLMLFFPGLLLHATKAGGADQKLGGDCENSRERWLENMCPWSEQGCGGGLAAAPSRGSCALGIPRPSLCPVGKWGQQSSPLAAATGQPSAMKPRWPLESRARVRTADPPR